MDSLNISTPFNEYDVLTAIQIDDSATVASEMLNRAKSLLRELEQFQSFLAEKQQCHKVNIRIFKSDVSKEIKILEEVSLYSVTRLSRLTENRFQTMRLQRKRQCTLSSPLIFHSTRRFGLLQKHPMA
jgi:hypothetical protein